MFFRRILIFAIGSLLLNAPVYAQRLTSKQSQLFDMLCTYLKDNGLIPETEADGVILFEYDERKMEIRVDTQEQDPMFVTLAAITALPKGLSRDSVALAARELNNYKGVKVRFLDNSFSVQTEMFLTDAAAFTDVFPMMVKQIDTALAAFFAADDNTLSKKEYTENELREKKSSSRQSRGIAPEGIYYSPRVSGQLSAGTKIKRVVITDEYTCVEITSTNMSSGSMAEWCNIDVNTYIVNEDKPFEKLKLTRASGIKLAPDKTYYGGPNKTLSFKLYFPPIPKDTKSISLIEPDSTWCFYGIILK